MKFYHDKNGDNICKVVRWQGYNLGEVSEILWSPDGKNSIGDVDVADTVLTYRNQPPCQVGDYIVKKADGEVYIYSKSVFESELVEVDISNDYERNCAALAFLRESEQEDRK